MVEVAYKQFSDKDFHVLSKSILIRLADDEREGASGILVSLRGASRNGFSVLSQAFSQLEA